MLFVKIRNNNKNDAHQVASSSTLRRIRQSVSELIVCLMIDMMTYKTAAVGQWHDFTNYLTI